MSNVRLHENSHHRQLGQWQVLAGRLSELHAIPIVHLDDVFWLPGGFDSKRSVEAASELIQVHLKQENWIAESVFGDLAQRFLEHAAELLWLEPEMSVCLSRLSARGSQSKRHMDRLELEQGLRQLLEWASSYRTRIGNSSAAAHRTLYESFPRRKCILKTEAEVRRYLNTVKLRYFLY